MNWRRHFSAFAEASRPQPEATGRLARRLAWPRSLAQEAPREPAPGAMNRLAERLRAPRRRSRRPVIEVGAVLLIAAAALIFVHLPAGPTVLDEDLSAAVPMTEALTDEVRAEYTGSGRAQGTTAAPRLHWEVGTLALDVVPHRGIDLTVETDEATVSVVGTAFTVTRDALGTAVGVDRGEVAVRCIGEALVSLKAGNDILCTPKRATGMLTRAQRLLDLGAPPVEVLDAAEQGLRLASDGDPAVGELLALRIQILLELGRDDDARRDAQRYLAIGGPRLAEVNAILDVLGPTKP